VLFIATCFTTLDVGGPTYAACLMTILICHEMGHFLQARRYGVYASYPYFIPMPYSPLGTFGAVIAMEPRVGGRRALFDIGITGPLAGLVPTIIFSIIGLQWSYPFPWRPGNTESLLLGEPLLFRWLAGWVAEPVPHGHELLLHPMAFAGWVGLLVTSLNLIPIGQLDGGHILYALLRRKARPVASLLLMGAVLAVIWQWQYLWGWSLILFLLLLMGPIHPPTANDHEPLGPLRMVLGWLTLAFIPLGFTPTPLPEEPRQPVPHSVPQRPDPEKVVMRRVTKEGPESFSVGGPEKVTDVRQVFLATRGVPLLARKRPIRPSLLADAKTANAPGQAVFFGGAHHEDDSPQAVAHTTLAARQKILPHTVTGTFRLKGPTNLRLVPVAAHER